MPIGPARRREAMAAGNHAKESLRKATAKQVARLIRTDEEGASLALEMGLVDQAWLDNPGEVPITTKTSTEVLQRFLERAVERRPSRLSILGMSPLQLLGSGVRGTNGANEVVAVMFTDLAGFTAFTDEYGDRK